MVKIDMKKTLTVFAVLGLLFYGASWYVQEQQFEYVSEIKLLAAQQEKTLAALSQTIDQDGADAVVSALIHDCATDNRARFDQLLSKLDTISGTELKEVDGLFDACGDYFVQRRAVMVARLHREFEVYRDYVQLLKITDKRVDLKMYPVEKWSTLVAYEKQRSELSIDLVRIQEDIIVKLIEGSSPSASEIQTKVSEASDVRDTLAYIGIQIDSVREDVIGL